MGKDTDWDNLGEKTCPFFEDLTKGLSSMHKVLYTHLPASQLEDVYSRIFSLLSQRLEEYFADVEPATMIGKQRIVDDITHLVTTLSLLRGVNPDNLTAIEEHFQ